MRRKLIVVLLALSCVYVFRFLLFPPFFLILFTFVVVVDDVGDVDGDPPIDSPGKTTTTTTTSVNQMISQPHSVRR